MAITFAVCAAADFDLAQPTIEMRRLQLCEQCREPLVVTTISEGSAVRCPKCQHVQRRLPNRELLTKVYQICPSCSARLDVENLPPDSPIRCGSCGFAQRVMAEAVLPIDRDGKGLGEIPIGEKVAPISPLAGERLASPAAKISPPRIPGLNADDAAVDENSDDENHFTQSRRDLSDNRGDDYLASVANAKNSFGGDNRTAHQIAPETFSTAELADSLQVSARVNGEPVSTAAVNQTVMRNLQLLQMRRGAAPTAEELTSLRQEIIAQLIEREILRQAAERDGYQPDNAEVQRLLQLAPKSQTRAGVIAEMTREEMKRRHQSKTVPITDADIESYFKEHRAEFTAAAKAKIRAITIFRDRRDRSDRRAAEQIAKEVKERLEFGISFAAVANRYSEDVFRNDGGLMRGTSGELIDFSELADDLSSALKPPVAGKIYGPIALPTSIAFCQLDDVMPARDLQINEVKPRIRDQLQQKFRDAAFDEWLAELKKNAVIEYQ